MGVNDFNFIAPIYDRLSRLVFDDQLLKVQIHFLDRIQSSDLVLVLGGGTGQLLEYIPICERIDFLEKSGKMIKRAKNRLVNRSIDFINADFMTHESKHRYDVIICPFFLDCFNESNLKMIIEKLKGMLKDQGSLIISDFESAKSNGMILKLMYFFFRFAAKLQSRSLHNINNLILNTSFEIVEEKFLHRNQLFSRLYRNL